MMPLGFGVGFGVSVGGVSGGPGGPPPPPCPPPIVDDLTLIDEFTIGVATNVQDFPTALTGNSQGSYYIHYVIVNDEATNVAKLNLRLGVGGGGIADITVNGSLGRQDYRLFGNSDTSVANSNIDLTKASPGEVVSGWINIVNAANNSFDKYVQTRESEWDTTDAGFGNRFTDLRLDVATYTGAEITGAGLKMDQPSGLGVGSTARIYFKDLS